MRLLLNSLVRAAVHRGGVLAAPNKCFAMQGLVETIVVRRRVWIADIQEAAGAWDRPSDCNAIRCCDATRSTVSMPPKLTADDPCSPRETMINGLKAVFVETTSLCGEELAERNLIFLPCVAFGQASCRQQCAANSIQQHVSSS